MDEQMDTTASKGKTCLDPYSGSLRGPSEGAELQARNDQDLSRADPPGIGDDNGVARSSFPQASATEERPNSCAAKSGRRVNRINARTSPGDLLSISSTSGWRPPGQPTPRQIACERLRHGYEDYLRRQRGLSKRTIYDSWRFADRFLDYRFGDTDIDLGVTSASDVIAFLQALIPKKVPFRDKTPAPPCVTSSDICSSAA